MYVMLKRIQINKAETVLEAILKSSVINTFARGFGYLKNLAIAIILGFNYQTDAVFMAISLISIFMIFVDVFDSAGIPNLVDAKTRSEYEFKKLAGFLFTFTTGLALTLIITAVIVYPLLSIIPVGFNEETKKYLREAYFLLLPYLFFSFFFHHFGAVLRSLRRFTHYFIGEFIFSLISFFFILLGLYLFKDYRIIPISMSIAQAFATVYIVLVAKNYIHLEIYIDEKIKLLLKHFLYLTALYGVFHLFVLVDKAFASTLGEKGVSALTYGLLIATVPRRIFKLEHMAITSLSELKGSFRKVVFYMKKILLLAIPLMFVFMLLPEFIVKILFGHGAFGLKDVHLTSEAVKYYSLSLPFMFAWPILYRTFQIINLLKPVFSVAIIGIIVNLVLNYILVIVYDLGILGICMGTLGAYIILTCGSIFFLYINNLRKSHV